MLPEVHGQDGAEHLLEPFSIIATPENRALDKLDEALLAMDLEPILTNLYNTFQGVAQYYWANLRVVSLCPELQKMRVENMADSC